MVITYFIINSGTISLAYCCHVGFQIHNKPHWPVEFVCSKCTWSSYQWTAWNLCSIPSPKSSYIDVDTGKHTFDLSFRMYAILAWILWLHTLPIFRDIQDLGYWNLYTVHPLGSRININSIFSWDTDTCLRLHCVVILRSNVKAAFNHMCSFCITCTLEQC